VVLLSPGFVFDHNGTTTRRKRKTTKSITTERDEYTGTALSVWFQGDDAR